MTILAVHMHLQQTKRASIESGGPQYYFHKLSGPVKTYLRSEGAVRVALVTPYGATKMDYFALSTDKKLDAKQRPIPGNVGHDRIQQGQAAQSIGEAIRLWYKLPPGNFERIDVDTDIRDDAFYLTAGGEGFRIGCRTLWGLVFQTVRFLTLFFPCLTRILSPRGDSSDFPLLVFN